MPFVGQRGQRKATFVVKHMNAKLYCRGTFRPLPECLLYFFWLLYHRRMWRVNTNLAYHFEVITVVKSVGQFTKRSLSGKMTNSKIYTSWFTIYFTGN